MIAVYITFNTLNYSMSKYRQLWIYGYHACQSALKNPRRKVFEVSHLSVKSLEKLDINPSEPLKSKLVDKNWFDKKFGSDAVHQGIALLVEELEELSPDDLNNDPSPNQLVIILDQVNDPHNVGAIIRSAAAFDAKAIVTTDRNAPEESAVLAKSASGALELVPIMKYVNLANAIQELKNMGFWIYGFAESGSTPLGKTKFSGKVALILGAEGTGMRDLTKKNCDFLIHLETSIDFSTLNVSNAAAIAMYEVFQGFNGGE